MLSEDICCTYYASEVATGIVVCVDITATEVVAGRQARNPIEAAVARA